MSLFTHTTPARRESEVASDEFLGVVLFCGVGLLISLTAVICGVQGLWF
jgi:hypothetical protein